MKNRSKEYLDNVIISDRVPARAFISCSVTPRIETFGNEEHLTWFAALNPGEEVIINYQATKTSDKFSIRIFKRERVHRAFT